MRTLFVKIIYSFIQEEDRDKKLPPTGLLPSGLQQLRGMSQKPRMQPCRWQEPRHLLQPSLLPPLTCTNQQEAGTGCQSLGSNPSTAVSGIIKLSALDFTLSLFVCLSLYSFTFVFITVLEAIHPGFYAHYHIFKSVFAPTGSQPSLHHNHLADNLTFTTKSDDCGLIH